MNRHSLPVASRRRSPSNRSGSTLLIVVALMGMMAFLGFVFYTFSAQEKVTAMNFAESAKIQTASAAAVDDTWDFLLQTLILGSSDTNYQSVLWGGRHSLMANMYGRDGIPWNGEGVRLNAFTNGQPFVDMDGDGTPTINSNGLSIAENYSLLSPSDSPAVIGMTGGVQTWWQASSSWGTGVPVWGTGKQFFNGAVAFNPSTYYMPQPDVDYTAPDINNFFLSYDGYTVDNSGNQTRVIIPSFLRPQYLRTSTGGGTIVFDSTYNGNPPSGVTPSTQNWYSDQSLAICSQSATNQALVQNQILRPHPSHVCVDPASGAVLTQNGTPIPRYVIYNDTFNTATSFAYKSIGLQQPFATNTYNQFSDPFAPPESMPNNANAPTPGSLGDWSPFLSTGGTYDIDLDVDTDNDGIPDSILMDLGYPPIPQGNGKFAVPLFAVSIRDLNGLVNVNASGNLNGNLNFSTINKFNQLGFRANSGTAAGGYTYTADNLSKSNQGLTSYEINPQRVLTADPTYNSAGGYYNDQQLASSEAAWQLACFLNLFDPTVTVMSSPPATPTAGWPARSVPELANLEWMLLNIGRTPFNLSQVANGSSTASSVSDVLAGRNGEFLSLETFLSTFGVSGALNMPRAGQSVSTYSYPGWTVTAADDNNNYNEGETLGGSTNGVPWVHPMDFRGAGVQFHRLGFGKDGQPGAAGYDDDGNGIIDDYTEIGWPVNATLPMNQQSDDPQSLTSVGATSPIVNPMMTARNGALLWPAYTGYHSFGYVQWGAATSITQTGSYTAIDSAAQNYAASLMRNQIWYSQLDDMPEAIIDPLLLSGSYSGALAAGNAEGTWIQNAITHDQVLSANEVLFLQGSSADVRSSDTHSRLAELMPANLVASSDAPDIRKRLTTISTGRREFGVSANPVGQLRTEASSSGHSPYYAWELTPQFPPDVNYAGTPNPYRPELFYFLQQAATTPSWNNSSLSLKLNVNKFLYLNSAASQYGFASLPPMNTPGDTANDVAAAIARQNMCRDIYTLLYTFCQGQDADYRTAVTGTKPTATQAAEMAQFAVNLVDAIDTDNIITAFTYDSDLSSSGANGAGWVLKNDGTDPVVYGVERQLLTLTEATCFVTKNGTPAADSPETIYTDPTLPTNPAPDGLATNQTGHVYIYFELDNVSPFPVTLASNGVTSATATSNGDWRIRLQSLQTVQSASSSYLPVSGNDLRFLYFLHGLDTNTTNGNYLQVDNNGNKYLNPGQQFTVASQDGTDQFTGAAAGFGTYRTSDFRLNQSTQTVTNTTTFPVIIPSLNYSGMSEGAVNSMATNGRTSPPTNSTPGNQFPVPACNLDLVWDGYGGTAASPLPSTRFYIADKNNAGTVNSTAGTFANVITSPYITLFLERRAANGLSASAANNTWAPVDSATIAVNATPQMPPVNGTVVSQAQLNITSAYKLQPLSPTQISTSTNPSYLSTIGPGGTTYLNQSGKFSYGSYPTQWQWQPDRDLASLGELLQIPVYGPQALTKGRITNGEFCEDYAIPAMQGATATPPAYFPTVAAARFLRPDNPDYPLNSSNGITNYKGVTNYGNRWYRLFDFLEVQNRGHLHPAVSGITSVSSISSWGTTVAHGTPVTFTNQGTATLWSPGTTALAYPTVPLNPTTGVDSFPLMEPINLPQFYGWPRTHGQLNMNMIRYPQVLNALIDDDTLINDPRFYSTTGVSYIDPRYANQTVTANLDAADEVARKWWVQFIKSRDSRASLSFGADPLSGDPSTVNIVGGVASVTNAYMPATAGSRPFRSFDSLATAANSSSDSPLENTLFRSLPLDYAAGGSPNQSRRLLEVGLNNLEHFGTPATEVVNAITTPPTVLHPASRYQILSKVMNNTTTRSNSFAVYATVQYYEAAAVISDTGATAYRIGGQLTNVPNRRAFFVIDRTSAVEQMKILATNLSTGTVTAPSPSTSATFPVSANTFSFLPNTDTTGVRANMNGIRWKDMVLFRQTLN